MTLDVFNPPGNVTDLSPTGRKHWSNFLADVTDRAIRGKSRGEGQRQPRAQFYNLTKTDTDAIHQDVSWIGFPRQVMIRATSDRQRWIAADGSRDLQTNTANGA
ncbi:hypothetical protein BTZ20_2846 [Rhodococcus sp. MTM3W5.2]|uniref:hypothetical protein n=1 Tax=Rhodococcus sp. MTM3W5.2 TaxID=1805827 RepID=UPI0009795976|nr:hypothetical protein [Rhodococcus sp. MTM3W5.2]AQA20895.1 hypothetical protein BTZ20_2846 [Rhodococcus sp. MTM3W5.2]